MHPKFKIFLAVLICSLTLLFYPFSAMSYTGQNSVIYGSIGQYSPSEDFDGLDDGPDFELGFQGFPFRYIGYEVSGSMKYTESDYSHGSWESTLLGLNTLVLAHYRARQSIIWGNRPSILLWCV